MIGIDIDKLTANECRGLIKQLRNRIGQFFKNECIKELKHRGFNHADDFSEGHDGVGDSCWCVKKNDGYYLFFEHSLENTYKRLCTKDRPE